MADFFLGNQEDLEAQERRKNSNNTNDFVKEIQAKASQGRITEDDIPLLSDDTLKRLKRTRVTNKDLYDVYMVSDPDYYDPYYNNPEGENENPIIALARTIKRVYKTYPDYLNAVSIREQYLDYLIEKHGGWDRYMVKKKSRMLDDWMPPNPIYSKMAYDRHIIDQGTFIDPNEVEVDDEGIDKWVEDKLDNLHTDPKDLEVKFDIFTDIEMYNTEVLREGKLAKHKQDKSNRRRVLNAADIDDLNNIVKSWYVSDDELAKKDEMPKNLFGLSPENIRRQFMDDTQLGDSELFEAIMKYGEDALDDYDPDELVVDDNTGRTMKASELKRRELMRHLGKCGWDEIALLQESGTASNYEISTMKRNKKNKKKSKKLASTAASDLLGIDAMSMIQNSSYDIFGPDVTAAIFPKGGGRYED